MKRSVPGLLPVMLIIYVMLIITVAGCGSSGTAVEAKPDRSVTDLSGMTREEKEVFIKELLEGRVDGTFDIAFSEEFEGYRGMLDDFFINDGDGQMLGKVTVETATGEMVSIVLFGDVTASGVPGMSLEELRSVAIDYLVGWGYVLDDGYRLESEEFYPAINYGPGPEEKTYEYRVAWIRTAGGVDVADDACEVTIDPYSSRVTSCFFPTMHGAEAEEVAEDADVVSEEEAIEAARRECPSPDEWLASLRGGAGLELEVTESAHRYIRTVDPQAPVVWQVEIMYEAFRPGVDHEEGDAVDHWGCMFEVDAASGEVVTTNMCK